MGEGPQTYKRGESPLYYQETLAAYAAELPKRGALLGLDIGSRTTGIAISDLSRTVATPLVQLKAPSFGKLLPELLTLLEQQEAVGVVVGYPLNLDGSWGPKAQGTLDKAHLLASKVDLPVFMMDERLSTQAVDKAMLSEDLSREKRKENKDKLAASYILQNVLDLLENLNISTA